MSKSPWRFLLVCPSSLRIELQQSCVERVFVSVRGRQLCLPPSTLLVICAVEYSYWLYTVRADWYSSIPFAVIWTVYFLYCS